MTSGENGRIKWLDAYKGLGIFLVVLGHMAVSDGFLLWISSFHMPMFFFASGYLLEKGLQKNIRKFCVGIIRSLLIPYLVFSGISMIFSLARNLLKPGSVILSQILIQFLRTGIVESNQPLWFLQTLFVIEIFYYLLYKLIKNKFILCAVSGIAFIIVAFFPANLYLVRNIRAFFFLALGCLIQVMEIKEINRIKGMPITEIICFCALFCWLLILHAYSGKGILSITSGNQFLFLTCSLLGIICSVKLAKLMQNSFLLSLWGGQFLYNFMHACVCKGCYFRFHGKNHGLS